MLQLLARAGFGAGIAFAVIGALSDPQSLWSFYLGMALIGAGAHGWDDGWNDD